MRTEAMNPQLIEAIIGCLLHDIGKPVQRAALGYPGRHSAIGRAFMKKVWLRDSRNPSQFTDEVDEADIGVSDRRILDAISYHHSSALRTAAENGRLAADAPATAKPRACYRSRAPVAARRYRYHLRAIRSLNAHSQP